MTVVKMTDKLMAELKEMIDQSEECAILLVKLGADGQKKLERPPNQAGRTQPSHQRDGCDGQSTPDQPDPVDRDSAERRWLVPDCGPG